MKMMMRMMGVTTAPPPRLHSCFLPPLLSPFSRKTSALTSPSPPPFMADYLVDHLGFPKDKALLLATKFLPHVASPEKPNAVIDFLRHRAGLSPSQVNFFVRLRPPILTACVSSTLLPKLNIFQSVLPSSPAAAGPTKDLAALVTACASSFGYSTVRLSRTIDFLRSLLQHDDRQVVTALRRCPRLLNNPTTVMRRNLALLESHGLNSSSISSLIHKSPVILVIQPERLHSAFRTVEQELSISSPSASKYYLDAVSTIASFPPDAFLKKMELLRSYGFGNPELLSLFKKSPAFFRLKDENVRKKLDFFIHTVGWSQRAVLTNAWMVLFSLESRLVPRYQLLKGLQSGGFLKREVSLSRAFVITEECFNEQFVYSNNLEGSDLFKSYMGRSVACKPSSSSSK